MDEAELSEEYFSGSQQSLLEGGTLETWGSAAAMLTRLPKPCKHKRTSIVSFAVIVVVFFVLITTAIVSVMRILLESPLSWDLRTRMQDPYVEVVIWGPS